MNSNGHTWNYEYIKQTAKEKGCRVSDLIVLAPQNDPFYVGTASDLSWARWFADLWQEHFTDQTSVHLRRIHYKLISQSEPVVMANRLPYENTETCWNLLGAASKNARYLNMVDAADFDDHRAQAAISFTNYGDEQLDPTIDVDAGMWSAPELEPFPDLPGFTLSDYAGEQDYHVEIWCEKSTQNDILEPLCRLYGATLQIGVGQLSMTRTLDLAQRIAQIGKPARVFYISDFDPAGASMPVAVSRKLEFFNQTRNLGLDVKLFALALTADQCREYQLPRTPIKESERGKATWETRHGEGATELDALEALYPGSLESIIRDAVESYFDVTLQDRVMEDRSDLLSLLTERASDTASRHDHAISGLRSEYETLKATVDLQMVDLNERLATTWETMKTELEESMPDVDDYPVPLPYESVEVEAALYDSSRSYLEQIAVYKVFQGKQS